MLPIMFINGVCYRGSLFLWSRSLKVLTAVKLLYHILNTCFCCEIHKCTRIRYILHSPQVMLRGRNRAKRLPCFFIASSDETGEFGELLVFFGKFAYLVACGEGFNSSPKFWKAYDSVSRDLDGKG